jgi:CPA1 family monovalent cation:H+ antiporter
LDSVVTVLILLLAVVLSGPLARLSRLPLPLVQIALGALIACSIISMVELDPDLFFLLFLPPLLFLDGWRIPKDGLRRDAPIILELALGLVVFTVLGVGLVVHWLIPTVPLPVAFALAAVVSPTDPIAVQAIAARVPIPKRMMRILEGEALLNDASGLVCLRFAVTAMFTGSFSLAQASATFLWLAIGGIAIGVVVTLGAVKTERWIGSHLGEDIGTPILVSLLIPFGAYLLAEAAHCSGVLAVVAAGFSMSFAERAGEVPALTRVQRTAVWDMVRMAANGVIFVLLGEQIPEILARADQTVQSTGHDDAWWLAVYVLAISVALAALRFAWAWTSLRLTLFREAWRGEAPRKVSWRLVAAMSFAGVKGAVTLAAVLTLPFALSKGVPFPARDLAVFIAAGVILVSLITASVCLPPLLRNLELPEPSAQAELDRARALAARAAIGAIEQAQHAMAEGRADADLIAEAAGRIMALHRQRVERTPQDPAQAAQTRKVEKIERQLRLAGLRAERSEIFRLMQARELGDEAARKIIREIDLLEARYSI